MKLARIEPDRELRGEPDGRGGAGRRTGFRSASRGWWLRRVAILVPVVAAGVWAFYANFGPGGRTAMEMGTRVTSGATPFPVALATAERGAVTGTVVYTGSVAPFNEQDIFPRVTGRIVEMLVYPGDAVRAGQVLARLDDVELSSRVREAEAMAVTAEASRAQMEADLVAAQHGVVQMDSELAMVAAELAYARAVAARSEHLVGVGAISRQEYENDRSMAASLDAKREAARARLEQARAMATSVSKKLQVGEAMVAQGRAALRTATVVRDYVNIPAPSSGYVVKRLVAPGVLVQPGTAILKIAQIDRVRLQANVGEKDVASIRVGSPVTVTTSGSGQASITARVTSVFPFIDQGPRTAVVEALVENVGRRFLPGQYVMLEFVTGSRSDALTVPRGAVVRLGGTAKVWVVKDERAEPREVVTGLERADRVEVVRGLEADERVIVRGQEGLYGGARIVAVADGVQPARRAGDASERGPVVKDQEAKPAAKEAPHVGH